MIEAVAVGNDFRSLRVISGITLPVNKYAATCQCVPKSAQFIPAPVTDQLESPDGQRINFQITMEI
ncbi:MAG: hypothetical protein BGO21_09295 [Dyadobacter sp. 50-39]|uniref:hypothetical protein n=1 Tax=Dyadobacter sp. 50-39 TaxID=1895756 RepID=UPI00096533F4|nr:hypothetical protein [Dyadobacter sp. 50-39]OJV21069.1 MAG: hypothetical protein BGO21_09295 [Dyadobacter sp. 50-39]